MKNVNYISLIYIFHIHLDLISIIIDFVLKLIHVSTFSIFNTRVANNTKESSVHKTVASCKSAVPNEIGNKATFPATDTKSTPPKSNWCFLLHQV